MVTLAEAVLTALRGFAAEVGTWTNQGTLTSITTHIAQIENAVAQDIHAGETAAKTVLTDLYGAFHGSHITAAAPAAPEAPVSLPATGGTVQAPAPVLVGESGPETLVPAPTDTVAPAAPVDPTPAPSTTTEESSAPSSTPSDSTTDTAAPAAPSTPAV